MGTGFKTRKNAKKDAIYTLLYDEDPHVFHAYTFSNYSEDFCLKKDVNNFFSNHGPSGDLD